MIQQDFNRPLYSATGLWRAPATSVGVETSGSAAYDVGPLSVELTEMVRWLAPRPGADTPRDLALTGLTRAALKGRILDGISVSAFADVYVFQGKRLQDRPGASFTVGVGLAMDRTYKPFSELAFLW